MLCSPSHGWSSWPGSAFFERTTTGASSTIGSVVDRDAQGVWHPHKGLAAPRSPNPFLWPMYPIENQTVGEERWTDVTFRLGLIARLTGRAIELG